MAQQQTSQPRLLIVGQLLTVIDECAQLPTVTALEHLYDVITEVPLTVKDRQRVHNHWYNVITSHPNH